LVWQVNDVGSGFSTPSVAGGRIYLLGNEELSNEFALALSAEDGRRLWWVRLGKVGCPEQNPNYPGARSTPTVDGNLLYALGSDGDLVCLEAAGGQQRWRRQLVADLLGEGPVHAAKSSRDPGQLHRLDLSRAGRRAALYPRIQFPVVLSCQGAEVTATGRTGPDQRGRDDAANA
jgi:outer membrane protein assembly factor BamB